MLLKNVTDMSCLSRAYFKDCFFIILLSLRVTDLETALVEECDYGTLRNICKERPVPSHLRAEVWQVMWGLFEK